MVSPWLSNKTSSSDQVLFMKKKKKNSFDEDKSMISDFEDNFFFVECECYQILWRCLDSEAQSSYNESNWKMV
jgi:hypothetical protein